MSFAEAPLDFPITLDTNGTLQAKDPICGKNTLQIRHFYIDLTTGTVNQCKNVGFGCYPGLSQTNRNEVLIGKIS